MSAEDDFSVGFYSFEQLFGNYRPKIDILLHCANAEGWSKAARQRLPDGLRRTNATHILLNFTRNQPDNESTFERMIACEVFYCQSLNLVPKQVLSAVVFVYDPQPGLLEKLGYKLSKLPGIYRTHLPILCRQKVIVLSELRNASHNLLFKCFAHRQKARQEAYQAMLRRCPPYFTPPMRNVIAQLAALTEQEIDNYHEELHNALIAGLGGIPGFGDKEPFADHSPADLVQEVEDYLRD